MFSYVQYNFVRCKHWYPCNRTLQLHTTVFVGIPRRLHLHTYTFVLKSTFTTLTKQDTQVAPNRIDILCSIIIENALNGHTANIINIVMETEGRC